MILLLPSDKLANMKQNNSVATLKKYNLLYEKLKLLCLKTEPKKTALALTLGITLGIMPVIGLTFIIITLTGFAFRLNQVILQTVHLLVSPFQFMLIPVFLAAGQFIFGTSNGVLIQGKIEYDTMLSFQMISRFGNLILYGLIVWLAVSLILGLICYRLVLKSSLIQNRN
jgi:uncharacterized protein (DUF2062 family)